MGVSIGRVVYWGSCVFDVPTGTIGGFVDFIDGLGNNFFYAIWAGRNSGYNFVVLFVATSELAWGYDVNHLIWCVISGLGDRASLLYVWVNVVCVACEYANEVYASCYHHARGAANFGYVRVAGDVGVKQVFGR